MAVKIMVSFAGRVVYTTIVKMIVHEMIDTTSRIGPHRVSKTPVDRFCFRFSSRCAREMWLQMM